MRIGSRVPTGTIAALDCFIVAGLLGVYMKWALLGPHWGAIARFLGKDAPGELTPSDRLGPFFNDIWLNLLVIPAAGVLIVGLVFRRYSLGAALVMSGVMSGVYFIELQTQKEVGEYLSGAVVMDLFGWTMSASSGTLDYVTSASLLKLGVLLLALVGCVVAARLCDVAERRRQPALAAAFRYALTVPAVIVPAAALVSLPVAYGSYLPDSALSVSSIGRAAQMAFDSPEIGSADETPTTESTLAAFRQLTHTPIMGDSEAPYIGSERDSDVIVFMMETGAARALDLAAAGRTLPGTGKLYPRAFVASQHYTSHLYSSDALYSVFSGRYPQGRRRLLRAAGPGSLAGLMTNAAGTVPVRRVYVPSLYHIELDDRMYEAFGAESVYAADETDDPVRDVAEGRANELLDRLSKQEGGLDRHVRSRLERRLRADLQALERMKLDIAAAIDARHRYMVMFFPEIGHGPWLPLHDEPTVLERGRALMELQDVWLREILDLVDSRGRARAHRGRGDERSRRAHEGRGSVAAHRIDQRLHVPRAVDRLRASDTVVADRDRSSNVAYRRGADRAVASWPPQRSRGDAGRGDLAPFAPGPHLCARVRLRRRGRLRRGRTLLHAPGTFRCRLRQRSFRVRGCQSGCDRRPGGALREERSEQAGRAAADARLADDRPAAAVGIGAIRTAGRAWDPCAPPAAPGLPRRRS